MMKNKLLKFFYITSIFISMSAIAVMSENVMLSVRQGIMLCFSTIIPSLFPFMVLSSLFVSIPLCHGKVIEKISSVFGITPYGLSAMLCGILCGFPVGAKCIVKLYNQKKITASEAENLLPYSNNASPLFVIGAVGSGMLGSAKLGLILYLIQLVSAFTVALSLKSRIYTNPFFKHSSFEEKNGLTRAICDSVSATLNVCGFIIFFSAVNGLLNPFIKFLPEYIACIVTSITEIANGTAFINANLKTTAEKLIFISFALGWSGISVHMQIASLLTNTKLKIKTHIISRAFMGIFSAGITYLIVFRHDALALNILLNRYLIAIIVFAVIIIVFSKKERKSPSGKSPLKKTN